jgi:phosphoribosylanthranilate isomerase
MVALQTTIKKELPQISIMRSIPIAPSGFTHKVPSIELAQIFETVSDYFLTDTLRVNHDTGSATSAVEQPVDGFIGITGRTCDWKVARQMVETSAIPVILAGGISPNNVLSGLSEVRPAGVDSCTGTNSIDNSGKPIRFKKDPDKVKLLVEAVRGFNP